MRKDRSGMREESCGMKEEGWGRWGEGEVGEGFRMMDEQGGVMEVGYWR